MMNFNGETVPISRIVGPTGVRIGDTLFYGGVLFELTQFFKSSETFMLYGTDAKGETVFFFVPENGEIGVC